MEHAAPRTSDSKSRAIAGINDFKRLIPRRKVNRGKNDPIPAGGRQDLPSFGWQVSVKAGIEPVKPSRSPFRIRHLA